MMLCVVNSSFTDTPLITNTLLFCLKHFNHNEGPKKQVVNSISRRQLPFSLEASYQVLYLPT